MLPIFDIHLRRQQQREEQIHAGRQLRLQRKQLRLSSDPFALPDVRFIELFRLNKNAVHDLITSLRPHLIAPTYRTGVSVEAKIFTALRFYATGCYQRSIGEDYNLGLSQSAVHRCIHQVTEAIDEHLGDIYIKFPTGWRDLNRNKELFMNRFNFPGIIAAIDGTHVAILKPTVDEHNFINRKGYHSLNVQIICDSNLKILNVNANFGGSTHDSFIWRQSQARTFLNDLYANNRRGFWLIGDSGYPLEPFLMTPFLQPEEGTPEDNFNVHHIRARNCVERCIGVLKMRFRCILKERTARYSPHFVGRLVNACAVLHNICIDNNIPQVGDALPPEEFPDAPNDRNVNNNLLNEGQRVRRNIVNRYFL